MSWVAAGTAAVGVAGSLASKGGSATGAGQLAAPVGAFTGGTTGDFNVGSTSSSQNQTTIWIIIAALVGVFIVWRATQK